MRVKLSGLYCKIVGRRCPNHSTYGVDVYSFITKLLNSAPYEHGGTAFSILIFIVLFLGLVGIAEVGLVSGKEADQTPDRGDLLTVAWTAMTAADRATRTVIKYS